MWAKCVDVYLFTVKAWGDYRTNVINYDYDYFRIY